jgi:hypothetical protein
LTHALNAVYPSLPGRFGSAPAFNKRSTVSGRPEEKMGKIEDAKSLKTASIWLGIRSLPPAKDESEEAPCPKKGFCCAVPMR